MIQNCDRPTLIEKAKKTLEYLDNDVLINMIVKHKIAFHDYISFLPLECKYMIIEKTNLTTILNLLSVNKDWNNLLGDECDNFWFQSVKSKIRKLQKIRFYHASFDMYYKIYESYKKHLSLRAIDLYLFVRFEEHLFGKVLNTHGEINVHPLWHQYLMWRWSKNDTRLLRWGNFDPLVVSSVSKIFCLHMEVLPHMLLPDLVWSHIFEKFINNHHERYKHNKNLLFPKDENENDNIGYIWFKNHDGIYAGQTKSEAMFNLKKLWLRKKWINTPLLQSMELF